MKAPRHPLRSEEGMTLTEILIAVGIGALAMYALTTILWNGQRETQSLTAKNEFSLLVDNLLVRLNRPDKCQEMFLHQFTTPANKTVVPPLDMLGLPGAPTTKPVPITLDLGNVDKGGVAVYGVGTKLSSELTILNFELMGKTAGEKLTDASGNIVLDKVGNPRGVADQYEIPLHIVASRRIGGYTTSTTTDTATGIVSTTLVGKSGGEAAVGGDLLQKTLVLHVSVDSAGKITGCMGQSSNPWKSAANPLIPATALDIKMKNTGSVGIGTDPLVAGKPFPNSKDGYKVDIGGQTWGGTYAYRSDARLKENVREIPDALDRVEKLHGVLFDWKDHDSMHGGTDQIGFLAQEVEQVFPEVVHSDGHDGPRSVAYENLIAPMVEALKARQKQLEQDERELAGIRKALSK